MNLKILRDFSEGSSREATDGANGQALASALVLDQLARILASDQFAHAERLSQLLRFTVEQTLNGNSEELKEYTLGLAVFGRAVSYDPRTDPIVRVEMGRLRSKLTEYYAAEGKNDPIVIDLPKGSYRAVFRLQRPEPLGAIAAESRRDRKTIALAVAGVIIALLVLWIWDLQGRVAGAANKDAGILWGPLLATKAKTTIVFSSPLFFEIPRYDAFVRLYSLNHPDEIGAHAGFRSLQEKLGGLSPPSYVYTQTGDALAVARLVRFLTRHGLDVEAIPAHTGNLASFKENNLILLGPPRMNRWLRRFMDQVDFQVSEKGLSVTNRNPQPAESPVYYSSSNDDAASYAVVATLPGLVPGKEILLIAAQGSAGTAAAAEFMTNAGQIAELEARIRPAEGASRLNHHILLEVLADKGEGYRTRYLTHHSVPRE